MKRLVESVVLAALAVAIALPLSAGEKEKQAKDNQAKREQAKKEKAQASPAASLLKKFEKAKLTDEQKAQIEKIAAGYAPKLANVRKKSDNPELAAARAEAIKKAKAEGLEGPALKDAVAKATQGIKASDDQKGARSEAKKVHGEFQQAVLAVLTAEQKEILGLNKPAKPKKPNGEKKPGAQKGEAKKGEAKKDEAKRDAEKKAV
jgi:hypothetical protein